MHTRLRADLGVFMCAVMQQLPPSGRGCAVCETSLLNLELLLPFIIVSVKRQCSLYSSSEAPIVPLEGICAVTPVSLMLKNQKKKLCCSLGINWRGLWSSAHDFSLILFREVHSLCRDVKRNRHKNLNVAARRDASVMPFFW